MSENGQRKSEALWLNFLISVTFQKLNDQFVPPSAPTCKPRLEPDLNEKLSSFLLALTLPGRCELLLKSGKCCTDAGGFFFVTSTLKHQLVIVAASPSPIKKAGCLLSKNLNAELVGCCAYYVLYGVTVGAVVLVRHVGQFTQAAAVVRVPLSARLDAICYSLRHI